MCYGDNFQVRIALLKTKRKKCIHSHNFDVNTGDNNTLREAEDMSQSGDQLIATVPHICKHESSAVYRHRSSTHTKLHI
jgi:hypothetical protein